MWRNTLVIFCFVMASLGAESSLAQTPEVDDEKLADVDVAGFYADPQGYNEHEIITIFQRQAHQHFGINQDSARYYYRELVKYGEEVGSNLITAMGYSSEAQVDRMSGQPRSALELYRKSVGLLEGLPQYQMNAFHSLGFMYRTLARNELNSTSLMDSSGFYAQKGLEIALELKDTSSYTLSYDNVGSFYMAKERYHSAIEAYLLSLEFGGRARSPLLVASVHESISNAYEKIGDHVNSNKHLVHGLEVGEQNGFDRTIARFKGYLGHNKMLAGDYPTAVGYLTEAAAFFDEDIGSGATINHNADLAVCQIYLGNLSEARAALDRATAVYETKPFYKDNLAYHYAHGMFYMASGNYRQAEKAYQRTEEIASAIAFSNYRIYAYQGLAQVYEAQGRYRRAMAAKDSVVLLEQRKNANTQQNIIYDYATKYESVKQEQEIQQLNSDNAIQSLQLNRKQRQLKYSLVAVFFALLAIGGVIYALRIRSRSNKQLSESNARLSKALDEKELLLKEIHHRVKNNLQVISGLLKWQSSFIKDENALSIFNEGQNRVESMAIIHQKLYQSENLMGIEMNDYIQRLGDSLVRSYNLNDDQIELQTNIESLTLDIDTVIPLGLILNELISNALKHAFPDKGAGEIAVKLFEDSMNKELLLEVSDNGVGMTNEQTQQQRESFGMELVETLSKKLHADLTVKNDRGTHVQLRIRKYKLAG